MEQNKRGNILFEHDVFVNFHGFDMSYSPDYLGGRKTRHPLESAPASSTHHETLKDWMIDLQYQRRHFVPWGGQPSGTSSGHKG